MNALYEYASAVWAAARYGFRGSRWRDTPDDIPQRTHARGTVHSCGPHRPVPLRPINDPPQHPRLLSTSEQTPGYCGVCGQKPCRCCSPQGDAA